MRLDDWDNLDEWGYDPRFVYPSRGAEESTCDKCQSRIGNNGRYVNHLHVCASCYDRIEQNCFICGKSFLAKNLRNEICDACSWVERCARCKRIFKTAEELQFDLCANCYTIVNHRAPLYRRIDVQPIEARPSITIKISSSVDDSIGKWSASLKYYPHEKILSGEEVSLQRDGIIIKAILSAINALKKSCRVTLYIETDYVLGGMQKVLKGDQLPTDYSDIWRQIMEAIKPHKITLEQAKTR